MIELEKIISNSSRTKMQIKTEPSEYFIGNLGLVNFYNYVYYYYLSIYDLYFLGY